MGKYDVDVIRSRYYELIKEHNKDYVLKTLNLEFEETIYEINGIFYVDCSDFSRIDVRIN